MLFKKIYISILILCFYGCRKLECVKVAAPEMIGEWRHLSGNNGFHYIYIQSNGKGWMQGENDHGNNQDTQRRKWFVKNNTLYFSRFSNKAEEDMFTIDVYPTAAILDTSDNYNFISAGTKFMVLNSRLYKKIN